MNISKPCHSQSCSICWWATKQDKKVLCKSSSYVPISKLGDSLPPLTDLYCEHLELWRVVGGNKCIRQIYGGSRPCWLLHLLQILPQSPSSSHWYHSESLFIGLGVFRATLAGKRPLSAQKKCDGSTDYSPSLIQDPPSGSADFCHRDVIVWTQTQLHTSYNCCLFHFSSC